MRNAVLTESTVSAATPGLGVLGPKTKCSYPLNDPLEALKATQHMWAQHPSLLAAMEDLMLYERWVSRVVLPIAFQWIEEHKLEVYKDVADDLKDDVGVVIAAAFDIVKTLPAEGDGIASRECNPVWSRIAQRIHDETRGAFAAEWKLLRETTCLPAQTVSAADVDGLSSRTSFRIPR
jgi:hypothetical protein